MSVQKKILVMVLVGIMGVGIVCSSLVWAQQKKIIYTTMDLKQDYEILSVIGWIEDVAGDKPMTNGYSAAWGKIEEQAKKLVADAVIGIHIDIERADMVGVKNIGRVLIYGTAVKFK